MSHPCLFTARNSRKDRRQEGRKRSSSPTTFPFRSQPPRQIHSIRNQPQWERSLDPELGSVHRGSGSGGCLGDERTCPWSSEEVEEERNGESSLSFVLSSPLFVAYPHLTPTRSLLPSTDLLSLPSFRIAREPDAVVNPNSTQRSNNSSVKETCTTSRKTTSKPSRPTRKSSLRNLPFTSLGRRCRRAILSWGTSRRLFSAR